MLVYSFYFVAREFCSQCLSMRGRCTADPHVHSIKWVRSVNPWDVSLCRNAWVEIDKPLLTNAELSQDVSMVPQLLDVDADGTKIVRGITKEAEVAPTIHTDAQLTSSGRPLSSSPSDPSDM
eukprot:TRINITY_DN723_c0_g1_i1.p3 TRINITY_DN723_c0_g1~~TRINITY_DN723_c0_g1_i1.p3  ORF type:complete len:122 (-),score=33.78 TRINITY_DN723_c0_g1_i1:352-717(-)